MSEGWRWFLIFYGSVRLFPTRRDTLRIIGLILWIVRRCWRSCWGCLLWLSFWPREIQTCTWRRWRRGLDLFLRRSGSRDSVGNLGSFLLFILGGSWVGCSLGKLIFFFGCFRKFVSVRAVVIWGLRSWLLLSCCFGVGCVSVWIWKYSFSLHLRRQLYCSVVSLLFRQPHLNHTPQKFSKL